MARRVEQGAAQVVDHFRDVRVASPAVNLPGPFGAALLIAGCGFAEQQATRKALKSAGLGVDDIGLFKVNETVADVPLIVRGFRHPGRRAQHQWRPSADPTAPSAPPSSNASKEHPS